MRDPGAACSALEVTLGLELSGSCRFVWPPLPSDPFGMTASLRVSLKMSDNSKKADSKLAGVSPQERRIFPRYPFSAAAEAVYADARLHGRTSDLSRGGCYVDTINPFPMGAEIRIRISKGNQTF